VPKLKKPVTLNTFLGSYVIDEQIGEGGAGRVFGGHGPGGNPIALKVLTASSTDKKRRFKNETAFLSRNTHKNIVTVLDHGLASEGNIVGPFYVMRRYFCSLREHMRLGIATKDVLSIFAKILDGVEAAHLQGIAHRDLKPENILCDTNLQQLAIADFGIASFTDGQLVTAVETADASRLANFVYAAPEQRVRGGTAGEMADIYALGLILNELFTGSVPHGTRYATIEKAAKEHADLDALVTDMLAQSPQHRPTSIAIVKGRIRRYAMEAVSAQKLSKITKTVVKADEIDDPLADNPLVVVGIDWQPNGVLTVFLDREVNPNWVRAFRNMGSYTSVYGLGPEQFTFQPNGTAIVSGVQEHSVQDVINHFKVWLPRTSQILKQHLKEEAVKQARAERVRLQSERQAEEARLRVLRNIRI
jgi:serine/threonine protein kinase